MDKWWSSIRSSVRSWLPKISSSTTGLYKLSSNAFHPYSVDATSLALDLYQMLGIVPTEKEMAFSFFDTQQEEATGFYHEAHVHELDKRVGRILEMSGTYFGYQVAAVLMAYNRKPKYPYRFYEQFLPSGAIERYMTENMPWKMAPMGAGNMVDHGATMMRANIFSGDIRYQEVLERMYFWLDNNQNPESGLWGAKSAQGNNGLVQGGYHLMRGLYFQDDRAPAYLEKITDTTLDSIAECSVFCDGEGEGCHDMDHFVILERMLHFTNGYRELDIRNACAKRLGQLESMCCSDGAFSFEAKGSITNHNRYEVTPGMKESDLVGTVFYLETLYRILTVLGYTVSCNSSITHGVTNENRR